MRTIQNKLSSNNYLIIGALLSVFILSGSSIFAQSSYRRGNTTTSNEEVRKEDKRRPQKEDKRRPQNHRPPVNSRPPANRPSANIPPNHRPPTNHRPGRPNYPNHKPVYRHNHFNYGHVIHTVPYGAVKRRVRGNTYYYCNGIYYRPYQRSYITCRPPVGAIIAASFINAAMQLAEISIRDSRGYERVYYTNNDGVYFEKRDAEYRVVDPPIGAIVAELPYDTQEMVIDGNTYYKADETYYEYIYENGRDYYRVVGKDVR